MRAVLRLLLLIALVPGLARAEEPWRATAAEDHGDPRVELTLVAERATVAPGERFRVGVRFALDPGWHVYFRNPGEAAIGTEVIFAGEGATVGEPRWPVPERLRDPSGTITTFGYEEELLLAAEARVDPDASAVRITAEADFLVCAIDCIPGRVSLERTLPVSVSTPNEAAPSFEANAARLPLPVGETAGLAVDFVLDAAALAPGMRDVAARFVVTGCEAPSESCDSLAGPADPEAAFFPDRVPGVTVRVDAVSPQPEEAHRGVVVALRLDTGPDDPGEDQRLSGILVLERDGEPFAMEVDFPLPRIARPAATTPVVPEPRSSRATSLGWVLLLALLGGLILNAMPCVLPVLAIKVVALGQLAHEDGRARSKHVGAYTAGILSSMLALGGVVVALRAAGTQVGWGFQLQEPIFATVLAAALVVFALGLFGVYAIGLDAERLSARVDRVHGLPRSFGEGVLAVVLATPCSAPFLGTAVGFAFAASAPTILLVFAAVGLGLAIPFALVALVPGARGWIPAPGPWMETLQRVLGFLLLGTTVWLLWLVGQLTSADGMARALAFLVALAAATWLLVRVQRRVVGMALAAAVLLAAGLWAFPLPEPSAGAELSNRAWSPVRVEEALAAGSPAFVDFTADWCITCRANERLVLESEAVQEAFAETGTVVLVADWTRRDERIRAVLAEHGKAGVPLYLLYRPGETAPEVLPELLTEATVTAALRRASADDTGEPPGDGDS